MKRKSNEREIKIPVNTMADEVISHLGFVRTSKRVMPEPTKEEADKMCQKAYEKVNTCYRKEVVYDLYRSLYAKLV